MPLLGGTVYTYSERAVVPSLREHFEAVWFQSVPRGASPVTALVPDACADIVWCNGALVVAGPDSQVKFERIRPGTTIVGVRFRSGAALPWLQMPVAEIVDGRYQLDAFWGAQARRLHGWVGEAQNPTELGRRLESILVRKLPDIAASDNLYRAISRIVRGRRDYSTPVTDQLCRALAISERTLRRRCHEWFGYGPKTLDRILRFQKFLQLIRSSAGRQTAQLASEAGYADQSHVSREARHLAGLTPNQIREQLTGWVSSGRLAPPSEASASR